MSESIYVVIIFRLYQCMLYKYKGIEKKCIHDIALLTMFEPYITCTSRAVGRCLILGRLAGE